MNAHNSAWKCENMFSVELYPQYVVNREVKVDKHTGY